MNWFKKKKMVSELLMYWWGHRLAKGNIPEHSDLELSFKYILWKIFFLIHLFDNMCEYVPMHVGTSVWKSEGKRPETFLPSTLLRKGFFVILLTLGTPGQLAWMLPAESSIPASHLAAARLKIQIYTTHWLWLFVWVVVPEKWVIRLLRLSLHLSQLPTAKIL